MKTVNIYADGGSRGNPGPSATGFVVQDASGKILKEGGSYLGITTNNQAEYRALLQALEAAKELNAKKVSVFMDSELVIKQLNGLYRVKKDELKPIYKAINNLSKKFDEITFEHIPRSLNSAADAWVNKTLDGQN